MLKAQKVSWLDLFEEEIDGEPIQSQSFRQASLCQIQDSGLKMVQRMVILVFLSFLYLFLCIFTTCLSQL